MILLFHLGKFKEGVDVSDPKKWKANFRCAMNSLPDVEQVKYKNVNKGQQAVRVYKILAVTTNKGQKAVMSWFFIYLSLYIPIVVKD